MLHRISIEDRKLPPWLLHHELQPGSAQHTVAALLHDFAADTLIVRPERADENDRAYFAQENNIWSQTHEQAFAKIKSAIHKQIGCLKNWKGDLNEKLIKLKRRKR